MKEAFDSATKTMWVWRLAIVKGVLFSIVTLGVAWQTATAGLDVGLLSFWDKLNLAVGITVLWGNQMISFFDKTASSIKQSKPPIGDETDSP